MSTIPLFVWPLGPVINTEPVRYVVNKVDHDRVVDTLREQNRVLRKALEDIVKADWAEPAGIAKAALTATSQPTAAEVHQRMFDHGDATSQEGQG